MILSKEYPNVTTILRTTCPFYSHDGKNKSSAIKQQKGQQAHKQIKAYLQGKTNQSPSLIKQIIPLLNVIKEQPMPLIEQIIYSDKYKYQGKPDLVGQLNNLTTVIDWVYSEKTKDRNYLERKFLQTAAYAIASDELQIKVEQLAVIVVVENPKIFQIFTEPTQSYRLQFLKKLGQFKNKMRYHENLENKRN